MDGQRTALVTGSARRVGRALAAALVADGWRVVVHATDGEHARDAAAELGAHAGFGVDLAREDAGERVAAALADALGGEPGTPGRELDLLVNNASTFEQVDRLDEVDAAHWARAMDVTARAPALVTVALLAPLRAAARRRGDALVVNIGDRAALEGWSTRPAHAAAKGALHAWTVAAEHALAAEARASGARVRMACIIPPSVLAPDEWDAERVRREHARGTTAPLDDVVAELAALVADRSRSGELVELPPRRPGG